MKKFRTAAILAATVFALGGLATWDEWQSEKDEESAKLKNRLTTVLPEQVVEIDYYSQAASGDSAADETAEGGGAPPAEAAETAPVAVTLAKKDGLWHVVKPVEALADEQAVTSLIKTVTEYTYGKIVAESKDKWPEFGLAAPQRAITLKFAEASQPALSFYVGNKAPVGFNVYVRTSADDKTYMGSQYVLTSTAKSLFDLRDKTLVKVEPAAVTAVTYEKNGEPTVELRKGSDGKFVITQPQVMEADSSELHRLLEDISALRATGFDDHPTGDLVTSFAKPAYRITWHDDKTQATSLSIVEYAGTLLAAVDPAKQVVTLANEARAKLSRDVTSFRNRRVLAVDAGEVASLTIDGDAYKLVHGDWFAAADAELLDDTGKLKQGVEGKAQPTEKAHVRAFVVDLEFAKTDRFIEPTDASVQNLLTAAPEHKIVVGFKSSDKPDVTIELFKAGDAADKYLVRRSDAAAIYRIAKSAFNSMKPGSGASPPAGDDDDEAVDDDDDEPTLQPQGAAGDELDLEGVLSLPGSEDLPASGEVGKG